MRILSLTLLLGSLGLVLADPCPNGWVYSHKLENCYFLQNFTYSDGVHWQLYSWEAAEANCKRLGAHLVSIHSKKENDFIYDLIETKVKEMPIPKTDISDEDRCEQKMVWIGYQGTGRVRKGSWTDGTPVDYHGSTSASEPDFKWIMGNDDTCDHHAWWASAVSEKRAGYVCKKPSCPNGWIYSEITDHCYFLKNYTFHDGVNLQLYNFSVAEANCEKMDSHLVSIHSEAENNFIYDLVSTNVKSLGLNVTDYDACQQQMVWIGLDGTGKVGEGSWTDGTPVDYTGAGSFIEKGHKWIISNEKSCQHHAWFASGLPQRGRFICKKPSKNYLAKKAKTF